MQIALCNNKLNVYTVRSRKYPDAVTTLPKHSFTQLKMHFSCMEFGHA